MSDHECPLCYARERVSKKCPMCNGVGRISKEWLDSYRSGERHADEAMKTDDGKEWLDITVSCIGRKTQ